MSIEIIIAPAGEHSQKPRAGPYRELFARTERWTTCGNEI
jgi:hypothetical protein